MHHDLDLLTPKSMGHILDSCQSWGASVWSFMIISGLMSQLWSRNSFQSPIPHDLDLWPFDPEINRAHPWLNGSKCMKFHDHRWISSSQLQGQLLSRNHFHYQCPMTLTFDLLTTKSIGLILDSWGASVWSFMIIGGLQSQLWSGNNFQSPMPHDLDLWPFVPEINRAHPWLMGSKCMKFHDHRWITESVMVRKTFTINHAAWPWPFTFWPRNQQGTSLTHGEQVYEVSWS